MKNSWINCKERLPSLHFISPTWWISNSALIYTVDGGYRIASINLNLQLSEKQLWITNDDTYDLEDVLYWQLLERPLLEDMRATQNYHLST